MTETITSDDLYDYGAWARNHKEHLDTKSSWLLVMRDKVEQQGKVVTYNMTDEKAAVIDNAVCALSRHNAHLAQVFVQHYIYGAKYRELGKIHKCSNSKISQKIAEASAYVIGRVSGYYDIIYDDKNNS